MVVGRENVASGEARVSDHHVVVTGGRDYPDREAVCRTLDRLHAAEPITLIGIGASYRKVSEQDRYGRCHQSPMLQGADRWAFEWGVLHAVPMYVLAADWDAHGNRAGPIRNSSLAKYVQPKTVVVAPGGTGTDDMKRKCLKLGARLV